MGINIKDKKWDEEDKKWEQEVKEYFDSEAPTKSGCEEEE